MILEHGTEWTDASTLCLFLGYEAKGKGTLFLVVCCAHFTFGSTCVCIYRRSGNFCSENSSCGNFWCIQFMQLGQSAILKFVVSIYTCISHAKILWLRSTAKLFNSKCSWFDYSQSTKLIVSQAMHNSLPQCKPQNPITFEILLQMQPTSNKQPRSKISWDFPLPWAFLRLLSISRLFYPIFSEKLYGAKVTN